MFQTCPKCAHVRTANETNNPGTCPACGLIFAKYLEVKAQQEAALDGRAGSQRDVDSRRSSRAGRKFLMLLVLFTFAVTALFFYQGKLQRERRAKTFRPAPIAIDGSSKAEIMRREFTEMFESDTALDTLAIEGRFTIVEVYLDDCAYCRELEAALGPLGEKRPDIVVARIHHSGRTHMDVTGATKEEVMKKVERLNARMNSYGLCGTPHVEVYGPDRQPLGKDRCGDRAGTAFLWSWIATETGIKRRSAAGALTGI